MTPDEERQERLERLAVDVDTRLANIWLTALTPGGPIVRALEDDDELRAALGTTLRAAYALGYCEALREDSAGRRAELHRAHGYVMP